MAFRTTERFEEDDIRCYVCGRRIEPVRVGFRLTWLGPRRRYEWPPDIVAVEESDGAVHPVHEYCVTGEGRAPEQLRGFPETQRIE